MATIAFFDVKSDETEYFKKKLSTHSVQFFAESIGEEHIKKLQKTQIISLFVHSKLSSAMVAKLPSLKMVALRSTGFDHVDGAACAVKQIAVCNVPAYGDNTVAEHTFGLLLSLTRHIHVSNIRSRKKDYRIDDLAGMDLKGKTIGIIGGGRIGMNSAKIARGFGMNIVVFDIVKQPFLAELLNFTYVEMDQLLAMSDVISMHAPYNKYTHHLINKNNIGKIKTGAIFVNTARGELVETEALLEAVEKKIILAAGLDVIENEDLLTKKTLTDDEKKLLKRNQTLLDKDQVLYTPHNAFNSKEAIRRIQDTTIENIEAYAAGKTINKVN